MYLSVGSISVGSSKIYVYDAPVTSSSTTAQTLAFPAPELAQQLFVDARGRLFVPLWNCPSTGCNGGNTIDVYDSPITSSSTPVFTLTTSDSEPEDVAEDGNGSVYVTTDGNCCVDVFSGPVTSSEGTSFKMSYNGSYTAPQSLAFDSNGKFYVDGSSIAEYTPPFSSSSDPAVVVASNGASDGGLAVDSSNRVFIANASGEGQISVYTQPFTSSSTPAFTLRVNSSTFLAGIAFDGKGDLWAVDWSGNVYEIGTPITSASAPSRVLTVNDSDGIAYGIAFGP
jgi:hypothetical protein